MIGSLTGSLSHAGESDIIFDVAGVGYRVSVTPSTRLALESSSTPVTMWVHTQLRQDALQLYGFATIEERDVFEVLLTTPGVGPSLAQAILGTLGSRGVVAAVNGEDVKSFEAVSGVGKKTAARLVLELQGKLGGMEPLIGVTSPAGSTPSDEQSEVAAALSQLGYSNEEVKRALGVLAGDEPIETALRLSLRELSRR